MDMQDVYDGWIEALGNFTIGAIGFGVEQSKQLQYPPSLGEFMDLCRKYTPEQRLSLTRQFSKIEMEKNHQRVEKIIQETLSNPRTDYKAWARRILANPKAYQDGSVKMAKEALANESMPEYA